MRMIRKFVTHVYKIIDPPYEGQVDIRVSTYRYVIHNYNYDIYNVIIYDKKPYHHKIIQPELIVYYKENKKYKYKPNKLIMSNENTTIIVNDDGIHVRQYGVHGHHMDDIVIIDGKVLTF